MRLSIIQIMKFRIQGSSSKYERRALEEKNVIFGGRLGMYRYMDMDQVIEEALSLAETELTYEEP